MSGTPPCRATAPGKLVVLGEYAVLEGAPAIVAAMNRRAQVDAEPAARFALSVPALDVHAAAFDLVDGEVRFAAPALQQSAKLRYFRALCAGAQALAAEQGGALRPCHLRLDTTAFYLSPAAGLPAQKVGLGSSAALCVALLAALFAQAGLLSPFSAADAAPAQARLLPLAHRLHRLAQSQVGSGVDVAASVYGGLLRFAPGEPVPQLAPLPSLPDLHWVTIWSGQSASTPAMLAQVAALKQREPQRFWALFERLATYAQAGSDFWALRDSAALCQVVDATYATLRELGEACGVPIVTEAHAQIHRQVRRVGGFYKTSGAGGGDVGIAFLDSAASAERLIRRLRRGPFVVLPLEPDPAGVQLSLS